MTDQSTDIRKAAVAGLFYPKDQLKLTRTIAEMFAAAEKRPLGGRPMALIAPHAGYPYSGQTAAAAFKQIEGEQYDTVVVVSPSHTVFFKGSSVYNGAGYETPLGVIEVDQDLAGRLGGIHPSVYLSNQGHAVGQARGEHALEVQLPFLQIALGRFKLVPVVMGEQDEDSIASLGETLYSTLKGTNTLMVASTDLSHFHPEKVARRLDMEVKRAVEAFDPEALMQILETGKGEACGGGPMAAVMSAAKRLGAGELTFLEYTNSSATTGDFSEVVGYLSAVVTAGEKVKTKSPVVGMKPATSRENFDVSEEDRRLLKEIAKASIHARLLAKKYEPLYRESLETKRGAFVTLTLDGRLRGCIGQLRARTPLNETVAEMAQAAAFDDPRFSPLTPDEFDRLEYEISVLSPLKRVHDLKTIEVGRDGLMIKLDFHSGLLLPQVATDNHWDRTTFLEQTCLKAGLPKNAYRDRHAEIYRFSAIVF